MMADGYDERVKMTVSCSHAQPMPDTSDDARLAREAQASYHQPGPDTSQDARLARELATNCQFSDDVIADDAHDSRQFDHKGKPTFMHFLDFCEAQSQTRKQGIASGEKPKPAEANTEAKPDNARTRAKKKKAEIQQRNIGSGSTTTVNQ
jgi:hypothetical protein